MPYGCALMGYLSFRFSSFVDGRGGLGLLALVLLLGGCSQSSYVGRQYDDFTAYYNTFHNAQEAFEKGLASLEERGRQVDRTRYVSIFFRPEGGQEASAFEDAIQKSADVLREHPQSKWVDDAILLIGKSYYYRGNYVGAAQKFREVLALGGERDEEARFWLARTLVTNENDAEAAEVLRAGLDEVQGPGPWTARLFLLRGELLVRQEEWAEAAEALEQGLRADLPGDLAARGAFLLGQIRETMEEPALAKNAYRYVQSYDPSYELELAARLNAIELEGIHGDPSRALDRLRALERDEKNYEMRGEMAIVRARIHRADGQYDEARRVLRSVLYGREPVRGAVKGRVHYDLATLHRDAYEDFHRAAAHFDTASTSLSPSGSEGGRTDGHRLPGAPVEADAQSDRYQGLVEEAREVARLDSLLRLGRMTDEEFQVFVEELREQRTQAEVAARADEERRLGSGQFGVRGESRPDGSQEVAPAANTNESEAGFLFHKDPARVQQGKRRFEQTWGDRPRRDHWRRRDAIRTTDARSGPSERSDGAATVEGDAAYGPGASSEASAIDLSAVPRDSASQMVMEADRAIARYQLANSLFFVAERPDSAATWYRRILEENEDHPIVPQVLHALAEAYRAQGDTSAAQETYRRVVERHPETDLAVRAREQLDGRPAASSSDRGARADSAYRRAYQTWEDGVLNAAVDRMLDVTEQYPDSEAAPRAFLAAGLIYWRQMQTDTVSTSRDRIEARLSAFEPIEIGTVGADTGRAAQDELDAFSPPSLGEEPDSADSVDDEERGAVPDSVNTGSRDSTIETASAGVGVSVDSSIGELGGGGSHLEVRRGMNRARGDSTLLVRLFTVLAEQYPEAPQAKRAKAMIDVLRGERSQPESVIADAPNPDGSPRTTSETSSGNATPSTGLERGGRPSGRDTASGRSQRADASGNDAALPAPTDPRARSQGGETPRTAGRRETWTLLVAAFDDAQAAREQRTTLRNRLEDRWSINVVRHSPDETQPYRIIIGRFSSEETARRAMQELDEDLREQVQVWRLSPGGDEQ